MPSLSKANIISKLTDPGIIAVIRARNAEQVPALCEAILAGGVTALEITMSTPNAIAAIRDASPRFADRALIGVGTVLDAGPCPPHAQRSTVVTPILRTEFVATAHAADRPIMLGAQPPNEAHSRMRPGATHQDFPG
jgi:2-dehydro-3-deoxyphosphogluconate aldolase/(4S)-4-hydroxy-2-oxoglutarate aldolase